MLSVGKSVVIKSSRYRVMYLYFIVVTRLFLSHADTVKSVYVDFRFKRDHG